MVPQNKIILRWKFSSLKFLLKGYAAFQLKSYRIVLIQDGMYVWKGRLLHVLQMENV